MGAVNFEETVLATSAGEGFNDLVSDAIRRHGEDHYNGTISTCSMGRVRQTYDKPTDTNRKKAMKYVEDNNYGEKWLADYIDLGVVEYKVITIKKETIQTKETPVIRTKFVVRELGGSYSKEKPEKFFDTKKQADDYAVNLAMKNNKEYIIRKEGVLVSGDAVVSKIVKEEKTYKTKPKLKPLPNRKIVEVHEYLFYGWAAQ